MLLHLPLSPFCGWHPVLAWCSIDCRRDVRVAVPAHTFIEKAPSTTLNAQHCITRSSHLSRPGDGQGRMTMLLRQVSSESTFALGCRQKACACVDWSIGGQALLLGYYYGRSVVVSMSLVTSGVHLHSGCQPEPCPGTTSPSALKPNMNKHEAAWKIILIRISRLTHHVIFQQYSKTFEHDCSTNGRLSYCGAQQEGGMHGVSAD